MVLVVSTEQGGEVLDETQVSCEIIDNENAVALIGDIQDALDFRAVSLTAVIDGVQHVLWTAPVMVPVSHEGGGEDLRFDLTCSGLTDFDDIVLRFEYAMPGDTPQVIEESMVVDDADSAHLTFNGSTPEDVVLTAVAVHGRIDAEEEELYLLWSA